MLIEFKVTNFRSINSTQTLSMVAAPLKEDNLKNNIFYSGIKELPNLVKSAAIYGANAAGKSNLIEAMDFVQNFVRDSAKEKQVGEDINVIPFRLNKVNATLPSEFELLFIANEMLYEYGFALNNQKVVHEWLFAYPPSQEAQRWFERIYDEETDQYNWDLNEKRLTARCQFWQEATRHNALFLSTAAMLNSAKLEPIVNWITNNLVIFTVKTYLSNVFNFFTLNFCKDVDNKQKILEFLQAADLNIVDFKLEGQLNFLHKINETEDLTQFPLEYESEGTKRLFIFAGPLMDILEKGKILMIDELDNSLHPSIVKFMLELIHTPQLNRHHAQIIFTTHDSSILDNNLLRRDQVWFVEKDKQQSSQLYPLTDFKPRPNESLQKGYLEGRYGALPFIGDLEGF
jgi:uncharacterized protein